MAIPKAPLFGFGASGQLGKAIVFGRWKGIDIAREYVVPANPKSSAQTTQRGLFGEGVTKWHALLAHVGYKAIDGEAWNRYAGVLGPLSGFNAFVKTWVNERVAGGTPLGYFVNHQITDTTANSVDMQIALDGGAAQQVTLRWGNSKTFFPESNTAAMVAGLRTVAALNTQYPAGTRIYYYFTVGAAGVDFARSGLYTMLLT